MDDAAAMQRLYHGRATFARTLAHLYWRSISQGVFIDVDKLFAGAPIDNPAAVVSLLIEEHAKSQDRPIAEILTTPAPAEFNRAVGGWACRRQLGTLPMLDGGGSMSALVFTPPRSERPYGTLAGVLDRPFQPANIIQGPWRPASVPYGRS